LLSKPVNLRGLLAEVVPDLVDGFDTVASRPTTETGGQSDESDCRRRDAAGRESRREVEGAQQMMLRQGRKKFGDPDPGTLQRLQSIADLDHLERMADAIFHVTSWNELVAVS
jgi:hypothetical protein